MTFEGLGQRLIFWDKQTRQMISKFSAGIVPQVGQVWRVPLGSHKYHAEEGTRKVKVLSVEITPISSSTHIDIDIICEAVKDD